MKVLLLALCINLFCIVNGLAQNIIFQKEPIPDFQNKVLIHSKPVLIFIDGPMPTNNTMLVTRNYFLKNAEVQSFIASRQISSVAPIKGKWNKEPQYENLANSIKEAIALSIIKLRSKF